MARIIPFPGDPHEQVQALLPWYVNGTLEDAEAANVDAHLAECARCRAELDAERALKSGVASAVLDPDHGWSRLRADIVSSEGERPSRWRGLLRHKFSFGWVVAAQLAVASLLLIGTASLWQEQPQYHVLGSAAAAPSVDAIILFKADAEVSEMRAALESAGASIVSGPTSRGAYLLSLPADRRASALESLRARPSVVLAEPLDSEAP